MPPLIITKDLVDKSLDILDESIGAVEKARK
jgi:4-aminobutyrate aminotransferase-like enzyme